MKHFYETIQGWFDFWDVYKDAVDKASNGAHFVEVGAWLGRSTSYMAVEIINSGKKIQFDVVDSWLGNASEMGFYSGAIKHYGDVYKVFIDNMKDVIDYIKPIQMLSTEASKLYQNESLDFIYIDAGHDYQSVKEDIEHWYPKLKKGGTIGGHDWGIYDGVARAVIEFFGDKVQPVGHSWLHVK